MTLQDLSQKKILDIRIHNISLDTTYVDLIIKIYLNNNNHFHSYLCLEKILTHLLFSFNLYLDIYYQLLDVFLFYILHLFILEKSHI